MKKSKIFAALLLIMSIPISLYITFWLISQSNPDRLIWFLYWINVPMTVAIIFISKLVEDN
jgi:hypothetical protein